MLPLCHYHVYCTTAGDPEAAHETRVSSQHRAAQEDTGVSGGGQEQPDGQAGAEEEAVPPHDDEEAEEEGTGEGNTQLIAMDTS